MQEKDVYDALPSSSPKSIKSPLQELEQNCLLLLLKKVFYSPTALDMNILLEETELSNYLRRQKETRMFKDCRIDR